MPHSPPPPIKKTNNHVPSVLQGVCSYFFVCNKHDLFHCNSPYTTFAIISYFNVAMSSTSEDLTPVKMALEPVAKIQVHPVDVHKSVKKLAFITKNKNNDKKNNILQLLPPNLMKNSHFRFQKTSILSKNYAFTCLCYP